MFADFEQVLKCFFSSGGQGTDDTRTGVRGLRNLGNTCFLNSVLQAVASCPGFVDHVHSVSELDVDGAKFSSHLHKCLTDIRSNDSRAPYNPHHVRRLLAKFNPDFEGNDEQDALEVFESLLACMKTECEEQVRREKADSRLRSTDMLRSIVPRPLSLSFPVTKTVGSIGKLSCPFEGWSCSHLECQACIAQEGPSAARWLPTRHQVFTTLPLPVALTVTGQLGVMKVASTAGCLPAGGREGGQVVLLRGGRPIEVVAKSTARTAVPSAGSSGSHAPYALHKFPHAGPSIYNCIQEFVQAEDLSGISCSACSTAATQSVVEKKLALAARSRDRNEEPRSAGATSEMEQQIMAEIFERCTAMRAVGEKDAFIADFDQGFIEHPLKDNKKEVIVRRKATATAAKPESPASIASTAPDAVATQREADREMLLLSLKQPKVSAAVKRTSLSRLPPLLCLYLCRRTYDGMKGRMKKLAQHVSFPVLLSMDQFHVADGAHRSPLGLAGALAVQGLAVGAGAGTSITALLRSAKNSKSDSGGNYQLRAVVEHKGTADTGHYVSYCLINDQPLRRWEYFSDEQHHAVAEETVLSAQATMLFYEKVGAR